MLQRPIPLAGPPGGGRHALLVAGASHARP